MLEKLHELGLLSHFSHLGHIITPWSVGKCTSAKSPIFQSIKNLLHHRVEV